MTPRDAKKNAEQFLKAQAAIMRKYGEAPKLSGQDYKAALSDTTKTFQTLSTSKKTKS